MAFNDLYLKSGDVEPTVDAVIESPNQNGAIDISGASAVNIYARDSSGTLELSGATASMTTDGTDGAVQYDLTSGDFDVVGDYEVEWEIDWDGAGSTERFPKQGYHTVHVDSELS